jgi:hypothetical protein
MACTTENQCLSSPGGHLLDPERFFTPVVGLEIFERPDMMHLDCVSEMSCSAYLTDLSKETFF